MIRLTSGGKTRHAWRSSLALSCAVVAVLAAGPASSAATTHAKAKPDRHNIYGNWLGIGYNTGDLGAYRNGAWTPKPTELFTPWGAAESKRLGDPQTSQAALCKPTPFGGSSDIFLTQFVKADKEILRIAEAGGQVRRFYIDGRKHSPDFAPTNLGESIAHWEGDTLVVDTVRTLGGGDRPLNGFAFNAVYEVAGDRDPRLPISDQLHMVERIRLRGAGDIMEIQTTIDDPKTYTRPFSRTQYLQKRPDLDLQENPCQIGVHPDAEGYLPQAQSK
jgi:hypothetical protein